MSTVPRAGAVVVTDDFSDQNDTANPTWTHLDGAVASTGQTWDASGGRYRLHDPTVATGGSQIGEFDGILAGFGFVGSYVPTSFTDVRVSADIVEFFPPAEFETSYIGFAVAARLNGDNGPPNEERGAALRGYSYQYEPTANDGGGEMVLTIINGNFFKDIGSFAVTLDPDRDYRVVLEAVANTLHGQVFELDTEGVEVATVADQFRDLDANPPDDDAYDGPYLPDRPFEPYESGFSGVYGVGYVLLNADADFTIDNFRSESWPPIASPDTDGDGDRDGADFLTLQRNAGEGIDQWKAAFGSGPVTAVPEPNAAAMLIVGASLLVLRGRRKN